MYKLDPPVYGKWQEEDFPDLVEIEGFIFEKAIRKQPYEGVIEQYRQACDRDSMHLLVTEDGDYLIEHIDEYNPDRGFPLRHFIYDHPKGPGTLLAGAGVAGIIGALVSGKKSGKKGIVK